MQSSIQKLQFVIILCFLAIALLLFAGCSLVPITYEDPGVNPSVSYKFDYMPTTGKKLKAELTFLLITPRFNVNYPEKIIRQQYVVSVQQSDIDRILKSFSSSMGDDFKEMMIERGFRLVSLVKEQAEATYVQREQSNFSITAKIDVDIAEDVTSSQQASFNELTKRWSVGAEAGNFRVKTRITLEAYEPLSWQLFWFKSLELDEANRPYDYKWNYTERMSGIKIGGDTRAQILASVLMDSYGQIMDRLWNYLDPDEFTVLDNKAKEIRGKFLK